MKITINKAEQPAQDIAAKQLTPLAGVIFKQGTLVTDGTQIVLVTGEGEDCDNFSGVKLNDTGYWGFANYSINWDNTSFKLFKGNIVLEQ